MGMDVTLHALNNEGDHDVICVLIGQGSWQDYRLLTDWLRPGGNLPFVLPDDMSESSVLFSYELFL